MVVAFVGKINHFDISQVRRRGCEKKRKNWNEVKRKRQQISGSTICSVLYGQRSGSLCVGNWRSLCKRQLKFLLLFYVYCWLLCFRHFSLIRIFFSTVFVHNKFSNCNERKKGKRKKWLRKFQHQKGFSALLIFGLNFMCWCGALAALHCLFC